MASKLSLAIAAARGHLPLPRLAQMLGKGSATLEKKAECPFCQDKTGKFAIYKHSNGRWLFKCHNVKASCVGNVNDYGHDEIAFLALTRGLSNDDAIKEYIQLAEDTGHVKLYDFEARPKDDAAAPDAPLPPAQNPWDALQRKLVLNAKDAESLSRKRGLNEKIIKLLGFRSNNRGNIPYIEELAEQYSRENLEALSILYKDKAKLKPNVQLVGKGLTGEKDEHGDPVWGWTEPVLIPYLDAQGRVFYLRPHKGGLSQDRDEFDEDFCSSHVYCPFILEELVNVFDGTAIITEGEFKVAAAFQARVPCVGIPGVTFVKKRAFRKELVELLKRHGVNNVVIIFDNEVRDDPNHKDRFQPDPYKREDVAVWAIYMARDLKDEFDSVTIGTLPDEWRVGSKADIDGALAGFVHGVEGHAVFNRPLGFDAGSNQLRRGLLAAIDGSLDADAYLKSFPAARRTVIHNLVERRWHPPRLKSGGDTEKKLVRRYLREDHEGKPIDEDLARAYRSVHGCYYKRRRPNKDDVKEWSLQIASLDRQIALFGSIPEDEMITPAEEDQMKESMTKEDRAGMGPSLSELRDRRAALYDRIYGLPEPISDAVMRCEYKKHGNDGDVVRLVRIKNSRLGKWSERIWRLPAAASCAPRNFREWGHATGSFLWLRAGQDELDTLVNDLDNAVEGRNIYEIVRYGHDRKSGLFFFGDCAFSPDGRLLATDPSSIVWHEGDGYQIELPTEEKEKGEGFQQKAPMMMAPQDAPLDSTLTPDTMLNRMCTDFFQVVGDYDAWLFIGTLALAFVSPELLRTYKGHPGAWIYGARGGGKTTLARWGMRMQGFGHLDGIPIDDATSVVGMNRALAQYSGLQVWFDEYFHLTMNPQKEAILRHAFDRGSGAKGQPDGTNKTKDSRIFTTPNVTGESSSSNSAARSRYIHLNVSVSRRLPGAAESFNRVEEDCKHYFLIGRYILENRQRFWATMEPEIKKWWEDNPESKARVPDQRVRLIYSMARASFLALAYMLEVKLDELEMFDEACLRFAEGALHDVVEETFTTKFWGDVISGIRSQEIELSFFEEAIVRIESDGSLTKATSAITESDGSEWIEVLFLSPKVIFDQYSQFLRKSGRPPANEFADMRRDISREKYFIPAPRNSSRAHKVRIKGASTVAWALISEESRDDCFPFAAEIRELIDSKRNAPTEKEAQTKKGNLTVHSGVNGVD